MKVVQVTWEDSMGMSGWQSDAEVDRFLEEDNMLHESVGFLIEKDEKYIAICLSRALHPSGTRAEFLKIPTNAVRKIRYLK